LRSTPEYYQEHDNLSIARYNASERGILDIEAYSKHALEDFLSAGTQDVFDDWELYTQRRASGSPLD